MTSRKCVSDLCKEHQITIEQLAERTALDQKRILAIVMGRWTPSPDERESVAGAFNVEKQDIIWGHKTPIQHIYGQGPG